MYYLSIFDIASTFNDVTSFGNSVFGLLGDFISFIASCLSLIGSYFSSLIEFLKTYLFELPTILFSIFSELPIFVQTGLTVVIFSLIIAFIFRMIKLIIPFT